MYRNPRGPEWRPPTSTYLLNSSYYWPFMAISWARNSGFGIEIRDESVLLQRNCLVRYEWLQSLEDVWRNSFASVSIGAKPYLGRLSVVKHSASENDTTMRESLIKSMMWCLDVTKGIVSRTMERLKWFLFFFCLKGEEKRLRETSLQELLKGGDVVVRTRCDGV